MMEKIYEQMPDHEYTATRNVERPGMTDEVVAPCPPPLKITLMEIAGVQDKTIEMLNCVLRFIGEEGKADTADAPKSFGDELRAAQYRQKIIADYTMRIASLLGVEL